VRKARWGLAPLHPIIGKVEIEHAMVDTIPLSQDVNGVFRVGGTRVTLALIVRAFERGATAEEIAQDFPSLQLSDVYQVIGYWLKHGAELRPHLEDQAAKEQALLSENVSKWSPPGLRERLLSRRNPQ
jgi:uncharacterized protein (DUF433 family)